MSCQRRRSYRPAQAFTLIEILIVVIILGILAAIVIPQFGSASKEAKQASLITTVQTLRSQIALFRLEHNDFLPGVVPLTGSGGIFSQAAFWDQLTMYSDVTGATNGTRIGVYQKGPYMQSAPTNPLCPTPGAGDDVEATLGGAAATAVVGYVYDFQGGTGSGQIWGTDTNGKTAIVQ